MQQITIYKIFTFILLPFAALFGFFSLILFFIGLANPVILLPVCVMACFTVYAVCCTIFVVKGIDKQQPLKPSLKDWIKVNGYVANVMAVISLINSVGLIAYSRVQLTKLAQELIASQPVKPEGISIETIVSGLIVMTYVMLVFSVVLLIQLALSFRLVKKHQYLFERTP
jgi:hypothetical protein